MAAEAPLGTPARRTLRIGIIGLGRAACAQLPGIMSHPGFEIAAAADPKAGAREAFGRDFQVPVFDDAEALCARSGVDAVYIATPHQFHAQHAEVAGRHGKHVVLEKPIALTLEEADAVIAASERYGIHLIVGHTQSYSPAVAKIREIVRSGELGKLGMVQMFSYTDFMYRPRRPEELDTAQGGGVLFNQLPHQVDIVRLIGGGMVRSVRAMTGVWDPGRPTEGGYMAFLEFEDGAAAVLVYNGYDRFDSDEFHFWVGENGRPRSPDRHGQSFALLSGMSPEDEADFKAETGYGGSRARFAGLDGEQHQPHFGIMVVSCHRGDLRPSADGLLVYGEDGMRELSLPPSPGMPGRSEVLEELYQAVVHGRPPLHRARWGKATLEVCLAVQRSGRERREIYLQHQVSAEV